MQTFLIALVFTKFNDFHNYMTWIVFLAHDFSRKNFACFPLKTIFAKPLYHRL